MTSPQPAAVLDAQTLVRPLLVKDLRMEARARGISPAGSVDELRTRIVESMIGGNDLILKAAVGNGGAQVVNSMATNNYSRPGGQ